jgi:hypothetical protein
MGLTIRIHHPLVRTEPTGQGQRRAVAEQSSSEVATRVSSSESMIRKPSSGRDALHTVGDSPGGAPLSPSAFCLRTHLALNTPRARQRRARHSPHHKGARDVPTRGRDHSPRSESEPRVDRQGQSTHPGREKAPPDRRHSHCHGRISRGITDASSVVAGLMSCNGAVLVADR